MTGVLIQKGTSGQTDMQQEDAMKRHKEKMALYKPRREASGKTSPADTLISDL